jgi:hypothetical protein
MNPICRLFFKIDQLTDYAALCSTDFIDWRHIHLWFIFLTELLNCWPHGRRNLLVYCCPPIFSLTSPPLPILNVQYIQTVCLWGGTIFCRSWVFNSVSDQIQKLPNCSTTPNKMTSEDDIKGLVSLKLRCPCIYLSDWRRHSYLWFIWFGCGQHPLPGQVGWGWAYRLDAISQGPKKSRAELLSYAAPYWTTLLFIQVPVLSGHRLSSDAVSSGTSATDEQSFCKKIRYWRSSLK